MTSQYNTAQVKTSHIKTSHIKTSHIKTSHIRQSSTGYSVQLSPRQETARKIIVWLAAEVVLNLLNMDTLADYSEFVFEQEQLMLMSAQAEVSIAIAPSCPWLAGLQVADLQPADCPA